MAMTEEARAARAKYMREWRKKNPEKVREYDEKKWEKKGQQLKKEIGAESNHEKMVTDDAKATDGRNR